jgi:hypothetical protein
MSKCGVTLRVDVTKIDKSKLYKGAKGTYLDLTTFIDIDEKDQYENNGFVTQSQSKDEREQGNKMLILGNVKVFFKDSGNQAVQSTHTQAPTPVIDDSFDDDIPF